MLSREACHDSLHHLEKPYARKLWRGKYKCSGGYKQYQEDLGQVTKAYMEMTDIGVKVPKLTIFAMEDVVTTGKYRVNFV